MNRFHEQWDAPERDDDAHDEEDREDEGPDGDDDFDYDEFVANEFGEGRTESQYKPLIRITAAVLLLVFGAMFLLQFFA